MAAQRQLSGGARHRPPIDSVVAVEAPVLIGEQHGEITRIDLADARRQPPAPVGQGEGAQQPAIAVNDHRRTQPRGGKIERAKALHVALPRRRPAKADDKDQRAERGEEAAFERACSPFPPCGGRRRAKRDG